MLLLFLPLPLLIKIYKFFDITTAYLIREPSSRQVPKVTYLKTHVTPKLLKALPFRYPNPLKLNQKHLINKLVFFMVRQSRAIKKLNC
jgi:hypothetical protein